MSRPTSPTAAAAGSTVPWDRPIPPQTRPMTNSRIPPHQLRSMSGARWPGRGTLPTASVLWAASASGEMTDSSTLRSQTRGRPWVVRRSQVVWMEATVAREGGSGRARERGRAWASAARTESSTAAAPEAWMRAVVVSATRAGSTRTRRSATVGRRRRAMASISALAVRAALDSRATRSRSRVRKVPRLSPRTAETGRTCTSRRPSASRSSRTSARSVFTPVAGRVSIWLTRMSMSSWRAPRPRR